MKKHFSKLCRMASIALVLVAVSTQALSGDGSGTAEKYINGKPVRDLPTVTSHGVGGPKEPSGPNVHEVIGQLKHPSPGFRAPVGKFLSNKHDPSESSTDCGSLVGPPIDVSTGAKIETYPIFSTPGEMGLSYALYYNTAVPGSHWSNSFDYWLDAMCSEQDTGVCRYVKVYGPDGSALVFDGNPTTATTFTERGGGGLATLQRDAVTGEFTLHDEDATTQTYTSDGHIKSITDASGIGWTMTYGPVNGVGSYLLKVTHTNGKSVTFGYTTAGSVNVTTVTDPAGNAYVIKGLVDSITFPGSPQTIISFKYADARLTEVDYNGVPYSYTTYVTDPSSYWYRWGTSTYLADGSELISTQYSRDASDNLTSTITNPLGHVTTNKYTWINGYRRLTAVSDSAVSTCGATASSRTYDSNGNFSKTVDNNGNVHTYTYAANGQLLKEIEAYGTPLARTTDYTWDPNPQLNRLSTVTVEGWSKTAYTYNAQNRLASVAVTNLSGNGVTGQTLTTNYAYTLYSNGMVHTRVVTQPSPNGSDSTTYTYDALGNLATVANGLGQTTSYSNYNGLGEPGHVVGANGDATDFVYDARGRVASRTTHPNGVATTWTYVYDGFGLLSQLTAPDGEITTWSRDPEMRVTSVSHNDKDGTAIETFGYDANSDVTSDVVSRGGVVSSSLQVAYDALGRPYQVKGNHGQVTTYSYDGDGNVLSMTDATGHVTSYQYDALDRVTQKTESGGASPTMPAAAPSLSVPSSSTNGNYSVSWTTVSGATDYELQEQLNGGSWAIVQRSAANGWSASGKTNGTYGYRVQACNATGCGPWSTTQAITVSIPTAPGAAPILTVPGSSATGAYALSWTTVSSASSYQLRQQFNGGSWSTVQSSAATSWSTSGKGSGSYGYAVQACNAVGCGPWSATGTVVVTLPPPPATPSLSVPATSSTGNYAVSWGAVSGAASYSLREQVNGGSWAVVQTSAATSWSASGQGSGSYGYEVQACNAGGCSAWSAPRTTTVTIPVPIAINGQSYSVSYVIPMQTSASVSIGFQISGGNTWKVFTTKPGVGNGGVAVASGAVPATASTVQLTWVQQGPPSGDATSGGSVSNPASSPVALGTNPVSQYTSGTYSYRIDVVGMQYQLRVDFFNAAGANVSSSTCTLTATMAGSN